MALLCTSMAFNRTLVAKKKGIDSTWIESGDLKQCDTFFKNLLPAQIYASSGPIDGSVEIESRLLSPPFRNQMYVYRKNCLLLATVFLGFGPVVCEKRGSEDKMRPVRVMWIALPLCTIGFDRNFDSPITLSYVVSPLWIVTSGREAP
jgi:hypothetical protein